MGDLGNDKPARLCLPGCDGGRTPVSQDGSGTQEEEFSGVLLVHFHFVQFFGALVGFGCDTVRTFVSTQALVQYFRLVGS